MTNILMRALNAAFPVREIDIGADGVQKVKAITFTVQKYAVEGVGSVSLMRGKAMMGLMRMETVILTPIYIDAPLFSYDRIRVLGNDTLIVELYDTFVSQPEESAQRKIEAMRDARKILDGIKAYPLGEHWYDSLKIPVGCSQRGRGCEQRYRAYLTSAINDYIAVLKASPDVDPTEKNKRTANYVDGLFKNGGPSTDAFKKALGTDKAKALFENVIFGIR